MKSQGLHNINKILIISIQGIGDWLLFTPCLQVIRAGFPKAKVYLLINYSGKGIVVRNEYIDEIIYYKNGVWKNLSLLVRLFKIHFDLTICAYPSGKGSAIIALLSRAWLRCGHEYTYIKKIPFLFNSKVKVNKIKHAVEMNRDLMEKLGLEKDAIGKTLNIFLKTQEEDFAKKVLVSKKKTDSELLIGMHITYTEEKKGKCWPIDNFISLINKLAEKFSANILLFGSKAEISIIDFAEKDILYPQKIINFIGKTTIRETAALINRCNLFIGNDSGLIHIAAACGVPIVIVFGPTDERIYAPYGVPYRVIKSSIECRPCAWGVCGQFSDLIKENKGFIKDRFYCKFNSFECVKSIEFDKVYDAVVEKINRIEEIKNA